MAENKSVIVRLNSSDKDLIDLMNKSSLPNATFMKTLTRMALENNADLINKSGILPVKTINQNNDNKQNSNRSLSPTEHKKMFGFGKEM